MYIMLSFTSYHLLILTLISLLIVALNVAILLGLTKRSRVEVSLLAKTHLQIGLLSLALEFGTV